MTERPVWGYDLDGVPIRTATRFEAVLRDPRRVLGLTEVSTPDGEALTVSTVHLVVDHNWQGDGPPVLWESMVFARGDDVHHYGELQWRYASAADALDAHAALVAAIAAGERVDGLPRHNDAPESR
jgi:hypothetical protein